MHVCPICNSKIDPVTGNPRYNAETIASIEEGHSMMSGKIPAKRFKSLDEMWEDLISESALSKDWNTPEEDEAWANL